MRGQEPPRRVSRAELPAGKSAERNRRVRRAKGRRADLGRAFRRHFRDGQECVEVRGLALVGRHAAGRVALQVLEVLVAFRERDLGVGHGDVVQQVEPLAAAPGRRARRHAGFGREWRLLHGRPRNHQLVRAARVGEHLVDRIDGLREAGFERRASIQRTDRLQRRPRLLRTEISPAVVEGDRRAGVRPEMHGGLPAAGDAERVAGDHVAVVEHDAFEAPAPERFHDAAACADLDALGAQPLGEVGRRLAAAVEHELHRCARRHEVEGGEVGGIVVGREHDLLSDGDAVAVGVLARGAGEQDAGQVVLREHERLLDRARREQRLLRVHAPVALAHGDGLVAEVEALQQARHAMVVQSEAGGRGKEPDAARRGELAEQAREPDGDRRLVDERVGGEQAAAALEVLLGEDDGKAGARGNLRGKESGRPAAHDEQVAVRARRVVARGITLARRLCDAGRAADPPLPEIPRGPLEGLVVEGRMPQARGAVERAAEVETDAGPGILRAHLEARAHRDHRRARGRLELGAAAERDQRVRLLGADREHAARPVQLHAAADDRDIVGEQRRGDGIAREGGKLAPVPANVDRLRPVDVTALVEPVAHQCATPEAAPSSIKAPVAKRSSPNPRISSCGRSFARVKAMVSPPAGIAL